MARHLARVVFVLVLWESAASSLVAGRQGFDAGDLSQNIANLGSFDYPVRMQGARLLRRTPAPEAVPALAEAARRHPNEFVRYRALVLLTAFNDPGTRDLMRELMRDRNDRVREVAFKWFERQPDTRMAAVLLPLLEKEEAEFVRPALVGALAAIGTEPAVQRALIAETSRGLDFFRSAVIEALGRHQASYALEAITSAAKIEGALQDDALLAIGRIGGRRASLVLTSLPNLTPEGRWMARGARCIMGEECAQHIEALTAAAGSPASSPGEVRATIDALTAIAQERNEAALGALVGLERESRIRERVAVAVAGVALRQPDWMTTWLDAAGEARRETTLELLKDGFDRLDEDFAEEQFFAAVRAGYWGAADGSSLRTLAETLIRRLEF